MNAQTQKILKPIASLRLTVVLFAMAMMLIFAGTLAQVHQGIWAVMEQYFRSFVVMIEFQLFVPTEIARLPGRFPFPGGFSVGGLLLVNLVAAHAIRFKFNRKRYGIIVIHVGIILLLVGELITALYSVEGDMSIDEGSWSNSTEDIREAELAVIDPSNPDYDQVVVIPESMLDRQGQVIADRRLPFEVTVDQWMGNSRLYGPAIAPPGLKPKATAGFGKQIVAQSLPLVTGVEGQNVDGPSAYVSLSHQGTPMGTWLVSLYIDQPQLVSIGGRAYGLILRFKREYKPYKMHLIDFRYDKFVGTEKARNFSSLVRLVDPSRNEDREVLIYMNHPLRHAGETFYQSSFKRDETGTVLQVVRNPGWLMPYVSCSLVSVGMLIHFGSHLFDFVRRTRS